MRSLPKRIVPWLAFACGSAALIVLVVEAGDGRPPAATRQPATVRPTPSAGDALDASPVAVPDATPAAVRSVPARPVSPIVVDDGSGATATRGGADGLVVSGQFVAPAGFTLNGAWAWVARWKTDHWDLLQDLRADAGPDGSFEIRGRMPHDARLALVGHAPGAAFDGAVEFRPGATDVDVPLVATGELAGTVVLPDGIDGGSSLAVSVEGAPARNWQHEGSASAGVWWLDSSFWLAELRPGTVDVVVRAPGSDEPLARIQGVTIAAGRRTEDPRLARIDLTRAARPATVRVVGADGLPVAGAVVCTRPARRTRALDSWWARGATGTDGTLRRATFGVPFDAVAMAPGRAPAEATDITDTAVLVLSTVAASTVTVRITDGVVRPGPGLELAVSLVWCGTAERPVSDESERFGDPRSVAHIAAVPVGPDGTATFDVEEPGRWQACLVVQQTLRNDQRHGQRFAPRSTEVVVTGSSQKLEIAADVDRDRYAAVCRELSK